jgi:hypothetical protein
MTSAVSRRVRKLERIEEVMEGQIYQIVVPANWTVGEALEHLDIRPKPNDIVVQAVLLGGENTPQWLKSDKPVPQEGPDPGVGG